MTLIEPIVEQKPIREKPEEDIVITPEESQIYKEFEPQKEEKETEKVSKPKSSRSKGLPLLVAPIGSPIAGSEGIKKDMYPDVDDDEFKLYKN